MPKTDEDFLPDAVKKQGQKADDLVKNKKQTKKKADKKKDEPAAQPAQPAEPAEPAIPVNDNGADATPAAEPAKDFEQKYKVLQGKYDREILEQRGMIDELSQTVQSQAKVIENLNSVLESLPAQQTEAGRAPDTAATATPLMDSSIFAGYGSEMVDAIEAVNSLVRRVDALEAKVTRGVAPDQAIIQRLDLIENVQHRSRKDTFYDALDAEVPNWGQINVDDHFKSWLNEVDPMSDIPRKAMLERAVKTFNQNQAIAIFKTYIALMNPSQPAAEPTSELETMVVPEQTGNSDPNQFVQPPTRYASKDEFLKAQADFVKKRISEADFNKIANSYQMGLAAQKKK